MSQNMGEKQTNDFFFEDYLKTFASVLSTASQLPTKDTHFSVGLADTTLSVLVCLN